MSAKTAPVDNIDAVQRITRRLDAVGEKDAGLAFGLSWYYIKLILLTGVGWAMDSMETFVFIYCGGLIAADIPMTTNQGSFLAGCVFLGSLVGSFLFGSLADVYGRRPMFIATLVCFLVGLAICGASTDITVLTLARMFSGIGLGGELPVASTLVMELSPAKTRAKIIVLLESFWAIGCMVAVVMAFYVAPSVGWRGTFYLCCLPVVYSMVIRFTIPESPKWLASVGRYDEAIAIVQAIEAAHGQTHDEEIEATSTYVANTTFVLPESHMARIGLLFQKQFCVRTLVLWTLWFGISMSYYAVFIMLPGIIGATGYNISGTPSRIFLITAVQLPGYLVAASLVEKLGRRQTLVIFLVVSFIASIALGYTPASSVFADGSLNDHRTYVVLVSCVLSFFLLGAWGCVYAYTPENYPTAFRGIGAAYPSGFSRIGAFSGPYLCNYMLAADGWHMSVQGIMWVFGGVLVFIAGVVFAFGYEPKGKNIESYDEDDNVVKTDAFQKVNNTPVNGPQ